MLKKESVSPGILKVLYDLMRIPSLNQHRLVGGTALALQIGHRISVDIDLFSDAASNYIAIEKDLLEKFSGEIQVLHHLNSLFGRGLSLHIQGIKTDVIDWSAPFSLPPAQIDFIRMASLEDIIRMKLEIITSPPEIIRYDKKDFIDIAVLFDYFSINDMIRIFSKAYPKFASPERNILEGLQCAELADKKPMPRMLIPLTWEEVKKKIDAAIKEYLRK
ncbi:MAG: nucleotidyl transferase AbiEii/AbiGii toxin family protein [Bacteroidota bacterium]|jgi:hypothetical protein